MTCSNVRRMSRLSLILTIVIGVSTLSSAENDYAWSSMISAVETCLPAKPGLAPCLKSKALDLLDQAIATDKPLALTEYLCLAPDSSTSDGRSSEYLAVPDMWDETALDAALTDRLSRLLSTRTLKLTIPGKDIVEGRRKKNKGMGMLMMAAMAMKGMMLQMAMGKIAMLAGKALMIGKMALLLSAIVGLRKLIGGSQQPEHPQVVYATEGHGHTGGWSRQLGQPDAHSMAYKAQAIAANPNAINQL